MTSVAEFIGVSVTFLCEIKHGRRRFSAKKAKNISQRTGLPLEQVLFSNGAEIYRALCLAYGMHKETMK